MVPEAASFEFTARIAIIGINPYVEIPPEISRALGKRGSIPVRGSLNGSPIVATLVPTGGGRHRLYINGDMRRQTGTAVGDEVTISLERAAGPRVLPVPLLFQQALDAEPEARAIYEALPPSHRNEYLAYLNFLKTPEALERNVRKVIARLLEKKTGRDGR
jgi:hypothetical protein